MGGIFKAIFELYIRLMVWLGAEPPQDYEYLLEDRKPARPDRYTVQAGDTIYAIARKFGVNYKLITQANGIDDLNSLRPGQTLVIPAPDWQPEPKPLPEADTRPTVPPVERPTVEIPPAEPETVETPVIAEEPEVEAEPLIPPVSEAEPAPETEPAPVLEAPEQVIEAPLAPEEAVAEPSIGEVELEPEPVSEPDVAEPVTPPIQERLPELEAQPPVVAETEAPFRYAVQRGDTLSSIARRYGVTVKDLILVNHITDPSHISIGQKLIIPGYKLPEPTPEPEPEPSPRPIPAPDEAYVYTIAAGDTLNAIARRYGVSVQELIKANDLEDPNRIRVGQKLVIPGVFKRPEQAKPAQEPEPITQAPPAPSIEAPTEPQPEPAAPIPPVPKPKPPPISGTDPTFPPLGPATAVRALYASYFAIGHSDFRQRVFNLLKTTEFNAVVVDVKGDHGRITYPTQVPKAKDIGAARPSTKDFAAIMDRLKSQDVYTIARIVTFKDNPLANAYPEFAVKTKDGGIWQDREQMSWVEPFFEEVWDYNIRLGVEAAQQGFDEVQFDYVRFPTTSQAGSPYFSFEVTRESRVAAVTGFLSAARGQLKPLGVKIAADIFGYTCWRKDDTTIGQDIERMGPYLDVICPMLYPSTFGSGIPGYKNAIAHPYEIVYESAVRAVERLRPYGCTVRPWIQDFQDYRFDQRTFGRAEIQAQIKGCFDSGSEGFLVWDPKVQYTEAAYAPAAS